MNFVKGIVKKYFRSYNRTLKDGTKKTYQTEQVQITVSKNDNIFEDKEEVVIITKDEAKEIEEQDELITALELFNTILSEENSKLNSDLEDLNEKFYSNNSKLEAYTLDLDESKLELDKSNKRLLILKEDCSNLRNQLEESKITISNLKAQLEDKNFIIEDLNENVELLNNKIYNLNSVNDNLLSNSILMEESQDDELNMNNGLINELPNNHLLTNVSSEDSDVLATSVKSSVSYTYNDYIELQREYIALFKKYEDAQENLYNEKVKVIHYKNLLDKFKSFIARLE